ncbi:MAG: TRAP transporter substrate-binding protein [Alphaproteobacteria bacterium]|nr:TRAP transporter substrate-binding protein [Alphaproteobacteria bacterium]MCB9930895.1 TRAP transporter substrate-binding protein [Alphaproteobacteria bacterium]
MIKKSLIAAATVLGLALTANAASAADYGKREFKVVGTWGNLSHWKERESRFWNKDLPEASGGALTANAKPYTELGLSGFEVMRLLKLGVYDAVHGLAAYTSQDSPAMEGMDLAGIVQDIDTYRKVSDAYRNVLTRELNDKYNAKLMMIYAWPSQQLWCNLGDKSITNVSLKDLKGKKIRTYSTTLGDFIEGLGASAVTIAFAEVVPALQKGVADCGITGTLPAYNAKWYQVVTHNIRVRVGFTNSYLAMNNKTWASLKPDAQALFDKMMPTFEDEMWKATAIANQEGMDCNAAGPCPLGDPGGMVPIEPSDADKAELRDIVQNVVVKRWAKRCGTQTCIDEWNDTVGKIVGIKASLD